MKHIPGWDFLGKSTGVGWGAIDPITSWLMDGEKVETVTELIFLGSKITADSDCSHEIKRYLLLGRKAMTNLDSILKKAETTLCLQRPI